MDTTVDLIREIALSASSVTELWESFSCVFTFKDGDVHAIAFAYVPGGAVASFEPNLKYLNEPLERYLVEYFGAGAKPPIQLLVQYEKNHGRYNVQFEDFDDSRWTITQDNVVERIKELRP